MKFLISIFLILFSVQSFADVADVCGKSVKLYANIIMTSSLPGKGISDFFPVSVRSFRVKTDQDYAMVKDFEVFDDKETYLWLQKGSRYILYKKTPGERRKQLDLYIAEFDPSSFTSIMMKLEKAHYINFHKYELDKKLKILAVMGVSTEGRTKTVEFVSRVRIEPENGGSAEVIVRNPEAMLMRYAAMLGMEGTESQFTPLDVYNVEWFQKTMGTYYAGMSVEQFLLDELMKDNEVFTGIANKIGDVSIPNTPKINLKFESCVPKGENNYGSAKAVFVPAENTDGSYTIHVFPGAFESKTGLLFAVKREYYHARWWNMIANLPHDSYEREAYMRLMPAYLEYDLTAALDLALDFTGQDEAAIHFYEMTMLKKALTRAMNDSNQYKKPLRIPWIFDRNFVMPALSAYLSPERNELISRFKEFSFDPLFSSKDVAYVQAFMPDNMRNGVKREDAIKKLVMLGYDSSLQERTALLNGNMLAFDRYMHSTYGTIDGSGWQEGETSLLRKAAAKEYIFHDTEWLSVLFNDKRPFSSAKDSKTEKFIDLANEYVQSVKDTDKDTFAGWMPSEILDFQGNVKVYYPEMADGCFSDFDFKYPVTGEDEGKYNLKFEKTFGLGVCDQTDYMLNSPEGAAELYKALGIISLKLKELPEYIDEKLSEMDTAIGTCPSDSTECKSLKSELENISNDTGYLGLNSLKTEITSISSDLFSYTGVTDFQTKLTAELNSIIEDTAGRSGYKKFNKMSDSLKALYNKHGYAIESYSRNFDSVTSFMAHHLRDRNRLAHAVDTARRKLVTDRMKGDDASGFVKDTEAFAEAFKEFDSAFTDSGLFEEYKRVGIGMSKSKTLKNIREYYKKLSAAVYMFCYSAQSTLTKAAANGYERNPKTTLKQLKSFLADVYMLTAAMDKYVYNNLAGGMNTDHEEVISEMITAFMSGKEKDKDDLAAFITKIKQTGGLEKDPNRADALEFAAKAYADRDKSPELFIKDLSRLTSGGDK